MAILRGPLGRLGEMIDRPLGFRSGSLFVFQTIVVGDRNVIVVHRRTVFSAQDRVVEATQTRVVAPLLDRMVTASRRSATVKPGGKEC